MISIAIPSSSLLNEKDPKIKAYKIGQIARAAAVFQVDEILIYFDPVLDESEYIAEMLEYAVMPQYLRKKLIPIKKNLRYAGVIPPLKIPSHKPKTLKTGEVREAVIRLVGPDGTCWVDVGAKALALLKGKNLRKGARVTVRVCSKKPLVVEIAEPREYWGYRVRLVELNDIVRRRDVVITSRRGKIPSPEEVMELRNPTFVFGNPKEGVHEIAGRLGVSLRGRTWNLVPRQGTETVRLEEAVMASLSVYNFLREV
ncbi:MAG: hypothetical protein DSY33_03100 [Archaeoglobus sp.]|nr:MAG: hypothetical protein DSY33_03100 [Archaeoglobus sp.]